MPGMTYIAGIASAEMLRNLSDFVFALFALTEILIQR